LAKNAIHLGDHVDIRTEYVTLNVSDGTSMRAYVAGPSGPGAKAGLLVMQEAFGVNAHVRGVTERFGREGYLAIAPELFHRTAAGFEGRYDDFPSVMAHMQALRDPSMEADFHAAHDWLRANGAGDNSAAVGFCMGGRAAFLAAMTLPLKSAVSFYGGGIAPSQYGAGLLGRVSELRAPVLLFWGGRDQHIPADHVRATTEALRAAQKSFVNVEFSDADHGFFCDARPSYNPAAAAEAWPLTLAFLKTNSSAHEQGAAARS
jgi:carboxymethylenebutenolidase